jgi:hypothetical protein
MTMNNESVWTLKEAFIAYFKTGDYPGICMEELSKSTKKILIRIASVSAEIRIKSIQNACQKRYRLS